MANQLEIKKTKSLEKYDINKKISRAMEDLGSINLAMVEDEFKDFKIKVDKMADIAQMHEVTDDDTAATANEMISQAAAIRTVLDKWRKSQVKPTTAWNSAINTPCKDLRLVLEKIESVLGRRLGTHLAEKQRRIDEAQRKINEELASKEQLEPGVTPVTFNAPAPKVVTELGTTRLKKKYDWTPSNPGAACTAAWATRHKQIREAIAPWVNEVLEDGTYLKDGVHQIPGIDVIEVCVAKTSRKR